MGEGLVNVSGCINPLHRKIVTYVGVPSSRLYEMAAYNILFILVRL